MFIKSNFYPYANHANNTFLWIAIIAKHFHFTHFIQLKRKHADYTFANLVNTHHNHSIENITILQVYSISKS